MKPDCKENPPTVPGPNCKPGSESGRDDLTVQRCAARMRPGVLERNVPLSVQVLFVVCVALCHTCLGTPLPMTALVLFGLLLVGALLHHDWIRVCNRRVAAELLDVRSVQAVGPLLRWLCEWGDRKTRGATVTALTALLPLVTRSDAVNLSQRERRCLRHLLTPKGQILAEGKFPTSGSRMACMELRMAVLATLTEIGTAGDEWVVRRLAAAKPTNEHEARVKLAAESCLEALATRLEPARARAMLLRASEPARETAETLLRER